MRRIHASISLSLICLSFFACSGVFYQPTRQLYVDPGQMRAPPKKLRFASNDGTGLTGWLFSRDHPEKSKSRGLIVQCHGNAENMTSHFLSVVWLVEHGYDVMAFDYRGYGASAGSPNQRGVVEDAAAAIETAKSEAVLLGKKTPIILYGQSLGGIVCMKALDWISDKTPIRAVVIEGSFLFYKSLARDVLSRSWITWLFQPLGGLLVSNEMAPGKSPPSWNGIPTLVIHGTEDRVVPDRFGKEIFEWVGEPKEYWSIPGSGHLQTFFIHDEKHRLEFAQKLQTMLGRRSPKGMLEAD